MPPTPQRYRRARCSAWGGARLGLALLWLLETLGSAAAAGEEAPRHRSRHRHHDAHEAARRHRHRARPPEAESAATASVASLEPAPAPLTPPPAPTTPPPALIAPPPTPIAVAPAPHQSRHQHEHQRTLPACVGWTDANPGGWNEGETLLGEVRRVPLDGLRAINQEPDRDPRFEGADGRAVVLLPQGLDPRRPVDVLLHLHGYYPGCRQERGQGRTAPVRDRDIDRMEEQLQQSGRRQLVVVLPQGVGASVFSPRRLPGDNNPPDEAAALERERPRALRGARRDFDWTSTKGFDATALATEVLARLASAQLLHARPDLHRVLLSAHSGGGDALGQILALPELAPRHLGLVAFFDGINGPKEELPRVQRWLSASLGRDLARLRALDPEGRRRYLREAPRFRAYHSQSAYYGPLHDDPEVRHGEGLRPLRQFLDEWFAAHAALLGGEGSEGYRLLRENYQVQRSKDAMHDQLLGSGALLDALSALPPEQDHDPDEDLEPLRG